MREYCRRWPGRAIPGSLCMRKSGMGGNLSEAINTNEKKSENQETEDFMLDFLVKNNYNKFRIILKGVNAYDKVRETDLRDCQ